MVHAHSHRGKGGGLWLLCPVPPKQYFASFVCLNLEFTACISSMLVGLYKSRSTGALLGNSAVSLNGSTVSTRGEGKWAGESVKGYHRCIEWLGLEGTSKIIKFQPPCCRMSYQVLDQAPAQAAHSPIQPGLEHLQGWGIHNLSGQPVPVLHHSLKNFPQASNRNLPSLSLKQFPLVLSLSICLTSWFPSCLRSPFKHWKAAVRSPQSLLFSRMKSLNEYEMCEFVFDHMSK